MPHKHTRYATHIPLAPLAIGQPALSGASGIPICSAMQNLEHWRQSGIVFSTWWMPPPTTTNPNAGSFHVLLTRQDPTSSAKRYLAGAAALWKTDTYVEGASTWTPAAIEWYDPYDSVSPIDILDDEATIADADAAVGDRAYRVIELFGAGSTGASEMSYTPAGESLIHCKLKYNALTFAALSLWDAPTAPVAADWVIRKDRHLPGSLITPYGATIAGGIGDVVHRIGDGQWTTTGPEEATRRILFQCGHPVGDWTSSDSYKQYGGNWTFPIFLRNLRNEAGVNASIRVAAVVTGDAGGFVKFTSDIESVELEIPVGGVLEEIIEGTLDVDQELDADGVSDHIKVEYKAATGGEITVHTVFGCEYKWSALET